MAIVREIKEIAKLARDLGSIDLYQRILDLQGGALKLSEQLHDKNKELYAKDKEIKRLQERLAAKEEMVVIKAVCYKKDDNGKPRLEEPYCQKCYVAQGKQSMLRIREDGIFGYCSTCGASSQLKSMPPEPPSDPYDPFNRVRRSF